MSEFMSVHPYLFWTLCGAACLAFGYIVGSFDRIR